MYYIYIIYYTYIYILYMLYIYKDQFLQGGLSNSCNLSFQFKFSNSSRNGKIG